MVELCGLVDAIAWGALAVPDCVAALELVVLGVTEPPFWLDCDDSVPGKR